MPYGVMFKVGIGRQNKYSIAGAEGRTRTRMMHYSTSGARKVAEARLAHSQSGRFAQIRDSSSSGTLKPLFVTTGYRTLPMRYSVSRRKM
jgi:hypothetical protein